MHLYRLSRLDDPSYDEADAFIVRAKNPEAARRIAAARAGGEGPALWIDQSVVEVLSSNGPEEVILRDFRAG